MKKMKLWIVMAAISMLLSVMSVAATTCGECGFSAAVEAYDVYGTCASLGYGSSECADQSNIAYCDYGVTHCSPCSWIAEECGGSPLD